MQDSLKMEKIEIQNLNRRLKNDNSLSTGILPQLSSILEKESEH